VLRRGRGADLWGWSSAYGLPGQKPASQPAPQQPQPTSGKS